MHNLYIVYGDLDISRLIFMSISLKLLIPKCTYHSLYIKLHSINIRTVASYFVVSNVTKFQFHFDLFAKF